MRAAVPSSAGPGAAAQAAASAEDHSEVEEAEDRPFVGQEHRGGKLRPFLLLPEEEEDHRALGDPTEHQRKRNQTSQRRTDKAGPFWVWLLLPWNSK